MANMRGLSERSLTILLAALLVVSFVFTSEYAFAGRRGGEHYYSPNKPYRYSSGRHNRVIVTSPRYYPGKYVDTLPNRNTHVIVRGRSYYYDDGAYYYRRPNGYVVVGPPIGTIVVDPEVGFDTVWVGGRYYYYYGNIFYRRVPQGYMVVEPPMTSIVLLTPPAVASPPESASGRVSVLAPLLNVRTGPSLSNPIMDQVKQNTTLQVRGRDSKWLYVELSKGRYGWIMEKFVVHMDLPGSG